MPDLAAEPPYKALLTGRELPSLVIVRDSHDPPVPSPTKSTLSIRGRAAYGRSADRRKDIELVVDQLQEEEEDDSRGDYFSLALFREDDDGTVEGIEFQRTVGGIYGAPGQGAHPYCVVTSDHQTFYGGVVGVEARGEVIDVLVTEEARSALELPEVRMSFVLRMNQADIVHAKRAMSRIFAGGDFEYDQPLLTGFGCPVLGGRYGGGRSTQNAISGGA